MASPTQSPEFPTFRMTSLASMNYYMPPSQQLGHSTLCTPDTSDPNGKTAATDMLISFTIWNQPIVQYGMPS